MAKTLIDLEKDKFLQDLEGKTAVNIVGNTGSLGLSIGGMVTDVVLNDTTWTALPLTALTGRNGLAIQNNSNDEIKINYADDIVGYSGIVVPCGSERFYDIRGSIILYGKSETGTTPTLTVEELA